MQFTKQNFPYVIHKHGHEASSFVQGLWITSYLENENYVFSVNRRCVFTQVKPALLRMKVTLVGLAISIVGLSGTIYALPGPPPRIEPSEDMLQTFKRTSKRTYSDSAARRYEPEAFAGEDDLSHASVATPTLFDYCQ